MSNDLFKYSLQSYYYTEGEISNIVFYLLKNVILVIARLCQEALIPSFATGTYFPAIVAEMADILHVAYVYTVENKDIIVLCAAFSSGSGRFQV